jgi:hypothetical protein
MPNQGEVAAALQGAIRLARLDAGGLAYFDRTLDGFWRSFFAALMLVPVQIALMLLGDGSDGLRDVDPFRLVAVEAIAYALHWLAYPCLMLLVVDVLDRRARFFDFMVPYNWANVPQTVLLLLVAVLTASGVLPMVFTQLLWIAAFSSILVYQWFVAKVGLGVPGRTAALLVLLDLGVHLVIWALQDRILRG